MFRLQRHFTLSNTTLLFSRGCHHMTHRDRQIAQLYRDLGEYHFRDNLLHHHQLLEEIHKLENQTQLDTNHLKDTLDDPKNENTN